ncbi:hypothetical protein EH220_03070 [bacterium]|nr:MAG: hypothetical protein EH220_03070 [bacterium]
MNCKDAECDIGITIEGIPAVMHQLDKNVMAKGKVKSSSGNEEFWYNITKEEIKRDCMVMAINCEHKKVIVAISC